MDPLETVSDAETANDHGPVSTQAAARLQQRASNDLRRGEPIILTSQEGDDAWLILPLEMATAEDWLAWQTMLGPDTQPALLLSGERSSLLGLEPVPNLLPLRDRTGQKPIAAGDLPGMLANLQRQAGLASARQQNEGALVDQASSASPLMMSAIRLLKRAFLLPAALAWPLRPTQFQTMVGAGVMTLDQPPAPEQPPPSVPILKLSAAPVPLVGAEHTRISVYRDPVTGRDINVIEIGSSRDGSMATPPLVRIHAACFTGDLLNSLKCDCGDQLKGAVKLMSEGEGGLILYMPQEGRDIGMANKMRSYALQATGVDTVDANLVLGFAVDERDYSSAGDILRHMGHDRIRLLTNNPDKVASMEHRGVMVSERVGHKFPPNPHSLAYMESKRRRTGHDL
ncbi:MAG: GTP cyclohydrolase II [Pseudomonadota bacterium]